MSELIAYRVRPAIVVPVVLSIGSISLAITTNAWALVAIPFIALGSVCAAPNLNLVDGFLVIVALVVSFVMSKYHQDIGSSIFLGAFASWFLSSIEKRHRAIPIYEVE